MKCVTLFLKNGV